MKILSSWALASGLVVAVAASFFAFRHREASVSLSSSSVTEASLYHGRIEPIFTHRCASCHSCNTAPCQLNFTSYDGVIRGASKTPLYQPGKQSAVHPTRLGIDAQTEEGWRALGFYSVVDHQDADIHQTNLIQALDVKSRHPDLTPTKGAETSLFCPAKPAEWASYEKAHADSGMPYGLPALLPSELSLIEEWMKAGAPGPNASEMHALRSVESTAGQNLISHFESFLNDPSIKSQIVSRYLYEHLFLAHLHFKKEMPNEFYRVVRSRTSCDRGIDEIPSVLPYDDPGSAFSYCIRKVDQTITEKNHIVYEMGEARLRRWQSLFFSKPWSASAVPSYDRVSSANPFITFRDIPADARYQWLLDDAQYTVMTFIKGAVCRGHTAVNVIDEQFNIVFLDPKADHFVLHPDYADRVAPDLKLPGKYGNNVKFLKPSLEIVPFLISELKRKRNHYRYERDEQYAADRPQGYTINDIWDGDGTNQNAVLTVYRHFDSAQVLTGSWGPQAKTVWVLDYPLFERIVYNLVTGFDVFGSMGHQTLTRVYMHYIRMEAEENYLSFLPKEMREPMRSYWYRHAPDMNKRYPLHPKGGELLPTAVNYEHLGDPSLRASWIDAQTQFSKQMFDTRMGAKVLGPRDLINAQPIVGPIAASIRSSKDFENEMRKVVSQTADHLPFSTYLDDTAYIHLVVDGTNRNDRVYTLVRNKEHFNIASILGERGRRDYANDSINILPGYQASYPNRFFVVELKNAANFLRDLQAIHQQSDLRALLAHYAISRQDPNFWAHYDWFVQNFKATLPTQAGIIDLVRYGNAEPLPVDDENADD